MIDTDSTGAPVILGDLDADWLLSLCEDAETQTRVADRRRLRYAARWALLHPADPDDIAKDHVEHVGGEGTPAIEEFAAEPLAAAMQLTPHAARQLISDALDLAFRLPRIWARVETLEVPAWRARRIAQATSRLTATQTATVDAELVDRAETCGATLIDRAVAAAIAATDPETQEVEETLGRASWDVQLFHGPAAGPGRWAGTLILEITGDSMTLTRLHDQICATAADLGRDGDDEPLELRKAKAVGILANKMDGDRRPRTHLYLHADLADLTGQAEGTIGVGSVEHLGPATLARIKDWVGHSRVTITPVLRMDRTDDVDAHDPPAWMRELVTLRDPHCVFPGCGRDSRCCDLDHITAYVDPDDGGPPGQTAPEKLAPLCRRHHRAKTKGLWHYQRHPDGAYTWTSPQGRHYLVDNDGTHRLD